jgi:23S rRNA (uracil1939-C5)-methyltransferase
MEGKAIFIEGALPGETVDYSVFKKKPKVEFANVTRILRSSPWRVEAKCPNFGICGGCSMQHLDPSAQVAAKQRILEDALWHVGRVMADRILPPIHGPYWEYRRRARLSVKYVEKKEKVMVGFNEKRTRYVTDMESCAVLPQKISALIPLLKEMIEKLSVKKRLPQIEVASGEDCDILVLRILDPLTDADEKIIREFSDRCAVTIYLQPKGVDSIHPFHPQGPANLHYSLPEFGLAMPFLPSDFTQVNFSVNRAMIRRAIDLLAPREGEKIADLFCGLGNFTLPIARSGALAVGMEGSATLVERAKENAGKNGISNARFEVADLFEPKGIDLSGYDKLLIDPPRAGAHELVQALKGPLPGRIVYVSCDPATLARDAGILVHSKGYDLACAGVINMFPHTSHVESIALFTLPGAT